MKHVSALVAAFMMVGVVLSAHGDYDHIRGVVTKIASNTISVETPDKTARNVILDEKTTFEKSGKPAKLDDLKVGDRVVIDVHKGTLQAGIIRIGAAKPAAKPR